MLKLICGDALTELQKLQDNSVDALITDPPAGISFMGKDWDSPKDFISNMTEIYKECLRVMKPGAHGLVWAIPRTSHWTATALEQAGFEIRDVVTHVFGSGFPKSLDVSKAIDKMYGAEREVTKAGAPKNQPGGFDRRDSSERERRDTPTTSEAKQWQGFGTALKPASEHWILCRKALGESTIAKNVLKHGTGGLNIDASRISTAEKLSIGTGKSNTYGQASSGDNPGQQHIQSRFPANVVLSHNEDCEDECTEGCAVKMLDEQSGSCRSSMTASKTQRKWTKDDGTILGFGQASTSYSDAGGASRFFYCAKASKRDRGEGNKHPTVKSTKLMEYLIRLITPPQGIVLDPFMGSGSTGVAAKRLGFEFIGIEREEEYYEIAEKRISKTEE